MESPDTSSAQELEVTLNNQEVKLDPAGYFLIRIQEGQIEVGFCNYDHQMLYIWKGSAAADISKAVAGKNLQLITEHSLYLGRELQRAEDALKNNSEYVQN